MMVSVTGGKAWQREMASAVASFMLKQTLPEYRKVDVMLQLEKLDGLDGSCNELEDRLFVVKVDSRLKMQEFVKTICHELIHVKQFVKKEMVDFFDRKACARKIRWKQTVYGYGTAYERMPWEKEAFKLQEMYAQRVFDEGII